MIEHIAHRGAKREFTENTMAAFRRAIERGANAIELDVHATSDGTVVINHDADLGSRFGVIAGRAIAELGWEALSAAAIGDDLAMPTLSQFLAELPPHITAYVEIKGRAIEPQVAAVIRASGATCAVHSFDHDAIGRMREIAPEIPRGILFDHHPRDVVSAMSAVGARDVWPAWRLIDRDLVDLVHGAGGRVIAWTVNERSVADQLTAISVDGVCTDDIRLLEGL